jgi:hypothetical protein
MAGYSARQSTYTTGDVIAAADTNDEFNQLLAAFNATTGHTHDGTAGDGGPVSILRDSSGYNKVVIDNSNNHLEFYVNVSSSAVEQVKIQDGAIVPVADNDIDLGTSSLEFKDLHLDGTANIDSLVADTADINAGTVDATIGGTTPAAGTFTTLTANTSLALASGATVTAINDEDTMSSDSATALATQQSIKAYVDSQVTAQDLDFSGDTGGAQSIDLDSQSLTITGGTGIDTVGSAQTITLAIDSTVATLTGSQTLTNKTLTTPVISSISNTGTITLPTSTDTLVGKATTDTLTNKTIDANGTGNSISNLEVADFAGSAIVLEAEGISSNDNDTTLPTSAAVKDYVDTQITAEDLDFQADSGGALSIDLDSETLTFTGGTGIDTSGSANTVTFAIDSTVATLTGSQTLTNKTLTSPVLNTGVSGTAVLDEDNMASNSATQLATQQSIKAYVDSQVATANELSELTDVNITSAADGALLFYDTGTSKWIDNIVSGDITIADTGVAAIGTGVIVNADINGSAAIDATKIHDGTISNTEFGYLNGVTSAIQTQLDDKASKGFSTAMAIAL